VLGFAATHIPSLEAQSLEDHIRELADQVVQLQTVVFELRAEVAKSREEIRGLRQELQGTASAEPPALTETTQQSATDEQQPPEQRLLLLEENQRLLAGRLEEQYQTKVESASRYRTKLSGVILLNAFANHGQVENPEVPGLALRRGPTDTAGTLGITALQSQIGFETYGPTLAGARASAGIQFDFSGISASDFYASSWGAVKLRTAVVRMDWAKTSLVMGQDVPFFSPLSPTSVASLAYPAFSYSGNLWTWIPQAQLEHRFSLSESNTLSLQGGVFDPIPRDSAQPGYASRVAWSHGDPERPLAVGFGGHYSRQDRGAGRTQEGWAVTADWLVPLGSRLGLSGEFYRGRAIGAFGAAQGRSVVSSGPVSDPASLIDGLNTVGGWAQLKFKASPSVEFHAAHGEDIPYRRDLTRYVSTGGYAAVISKNRTEMFNVVYRPRTDLLFSVEYRRLRTWRLSSESETADHVNLGIGVLF
jgi:hypothetical protein